MMSSGLFSNQTHWFDGLANSLGYENVCHYAVIIDAGSSSTKLLAYNFRVPFTVFGPSNMDLVDEFIEEVKPGLLYYKDEPEKGAETIVQLIKKAELFTPPKKKSKTPLIVRVTRDLLLLSKDKAQQLIDTVASRIATYSNLGLLAARYGIFRMEAGNNTTNEFSSVCVNPLVQGKSWVFANKSYVISGSNQTGYSRCFELIRRYVLASKERKPFHFPSGIAIPATGYFYDVAADAGIIGPNCMVSRSTFQDAAERACSVPNVEQPWACMDLVYVNALMWMGFKINHERPIRLYKKVDGHEVSWALGLAYTTVMDRIAAAVTN